MAKHKSTKSKSNSTDNVFDNVTRSIDHKNKLHTNPKNNLKKKKKLFQWELTSHHPHSLSLELFHKRNFLFIELFEITRNIYDYPCKPIS